MDNPWPIGRTAISGIIMTIRPSGPDADDESAISKIIDFELIG